jgi:hypothetical protein
MKYFLDTEFIEDGKTIELLSIGIVAEDGRELYFETPLAAKIWEDPTRCKNEWIRENVIPYLGTVDPLPSKYQAGTILEFVIGKKPEFWGYYADYDWVVFCWIFGKMIDLPEGFPMYCNDIKQLAMSMGNPELPKQTSTEHHALADALWNKQAYEFLMRPSPVQEVVKGEER